MPPRTPKWQLDDHTRGKHLVLRSYLNAWFPKLAQTNYRVLFIDGFAGPGEYIGGDPGSPLIALQALKEHVARPNMRGELLFLFIEKDKERAAYLEELLAEQAYPETPVIKYEVVNSTFDGTLSAVFKEIDERNSSLAPAFVMIDPFGVSDTPMSVIERILRNRKSEVFISFMYEAINRFKETPEFERHLDSLFGCDDWRKGIDMPDSQERKDFFYGLYESQLKDAGAQYVVHFELYEGNRLVYTIFFGTKNLDACDAMKQAIWKVDPLGKFQFRGARSGQLTFDKVLVDLTRLENELNNQFGGLASVGIEQIQAFVKSDQTEFHTGHLKRKTLKPMEDDRRLEVVSSPRKNKGTYPKGTVLRFVK